MQLYYPLSFLEFALMERHPLRGPQKTLALSMDIPALPFSGKKRINVTAKQIILHSQMHNNTPPKNILRLHTALTNELSFSGFALTRKISAAKHPQRTPRIAERYFLQ
jgi:hypothetical protein